MARVPTPASQGAQSLGGVQVNTGTQPFKSLNIPRMDGTANLLGQMAQGAAGIAELGDAIDAKNADAFLLETQRNITTYRQDQVTSWSAPAFNEDGSTNQLSALGAMATKDWAAGREEDFARMTNQLKSDKRYQNLSDERKLAIDTAIQTESLAHRAQVMEHFQTQSNANLAAEYKANIALASDEAIAAINSPGMAYSHMRKAMSFIDSQAQMAGASVSDPAYQVAAKAQLDMIAQTAVTNILDSNDPDRVEKARQYLAVATEIDLGDGVTVKLSADMKKDLTTMIQGSAQISKGRSIGDDIYNKHGSNKKDALAAIRKQNLDPETEDFAIAQYERWTVADASQKAQQKQDAIDRGAVNALNGQPPSDTDKYIMGPENYKALSAQADYWSMINAGDATLVDDQGTLNGWYQMTTDQRAKIPPSTFMNGYANAVRPETRQVMIAEWIAARKAKQVEDDALASAMAKEAADTIKSEYSSNNTYAKNQIDTAAKMYYPDSGDVDKRSGFILALTREFKERHTPDRPMSSQEINAFVNDMTTKFVIESGEAEGEYYLYETVLDNLVDEDGKRISGIDFSTTAIGMEVDSADVPELVRWYRRSNNLDADDKVTMSKVNVFYDKNIGIVNREYIEGLDKDIRANIDAALMQAGLPITGPNRVAFYRSYLIQEGGR